MTTFATTCTVCRRRAIWLVLPALVIAGRAAGQPGTVVGEQKISSTAGGFTGPLVDGDRFGAGVAAIGDLDGDLVGDIVVGACGDNDGGPDRGAIWVLLLNPDGTVKAEQRISRNAGNCLCDIFNGDRFGASVAALGDLNDDGVPDVAVGQPGEDDGGENRGAAYILFLSRDGTVSDRQQISDTEGGFGGTLANFDSFGTSVAGLGDLDGDGVEDLAVGATGDDDGGESSGAVWVLLLNTDGTVRDQQKISAAAGGFGGTLLPSDFFGSALATLGDLGGDGTLELAVGAMGDDGASPQPTARGAVWILSLSADGTVAGEQRISEDEGGFTGSLDDLDWFGSSLAALGNVDGDGVGDLAVGALGDDDGEAKAGATWVLFLQSDGTARGHQKISALEGGLTGPLDAGGELGSALALVEQRNPGGPVTVAAGAWTDDDGGSGSCQDFNLCDRGAVWLLEIETVSLCPFDCGDGDGTVGTADLLALLGQWGGPGSCDLDGSGMVGTADLLILLGAWGPC